MATRKRVPLFDRNPRHGWYDYANIQKHPGNIWFVRCAPVGTDAVGWGMSPDSPFASIDYAVAQCVDNQGDVIYCLPGHNEVLAAAGDLDLDVIGISIIGIGEGVTQPTITLGTVNTVDVDIDAASVTIENMHFYAAVAGIVAAIDVNASDFTLRNCRFDCDAACNAAIWVQDAAAMGSHAITIENCTVYDGGANTHFVNFAGTGNRHIVRDNTLVGLWATAAIGGAGVITQATIANNRISNSDATADNCLNFAALATGLLVNNRASNGAAAANQITAAAMVKCENYGAIIADSSGRLEPVAT